MEEAGFAPATFLTTLHEGVENIPSPKAVRPSKGDAAKQQRRAEKEAARQQQQKEDEASTADAHLARSDAQNKRRYERMLEAALALLPPCAVRSRRLLRHQLVTSSC